MKLTLPTGNQALVVRFDCLDEINVETFRKIDLNAVPRYICICLEKDNVKCYVMAVNRELHKQEIVQELREDLEFQFNVLKQL